ncbi:MBL fold metallo-hydrolase [Plantactinospora sp. GCM10030261]|uniref:MBL fold metallo-hydrolase n=1 Tax=Plantactinospora sp. GCM10030261 TaxID=3273420 RepID=UPI0036121000
MDIVQITVNLFFLRFPIGHVYLWRDPDGLTIVDAGAPGSGPRIAEAIRGLGHDLREVRRLVLTHGHQDHVGGAADIASWGDIEVIAHRADAPVIRGEVVPPAPDLADFERPIFDAVSVQLPAEPPAPVRVDREVDQGDVLDVGEGAVVLAVPGHTAGGIALHLPDWKVVFTGDIAARNPRSRDPEAPVFPGLFNVDRAEALASYRRLAALDVEIACFGHGEPLTAAAGERMRAAGDRMP